MKIFFVSLLVLQVVISVVIRIQLCNRPDKKGSECPILSCKTLISAIEGTFALSDMALLCFCFIPTINPCNLLAVCFLVLLIALLVEILANIWYYYLKKRFDK